MRQHLVPLLSLMVLAACDGSAERSNQSGRARQALEVASADEISELIADLTCGDSLIAARAASRVGRRSGEARYVTLPLIKLITNKAPLQWEFAPYRRPDPTSPSLEASKALQRIGPDAVPYICSYIEHNWTGDVGLQSDVGADGVPWFRISVLGTDMGADAVDELITALASDNKNVRDWAFDAVAVLACKDADLPDAEQCVRQKLVETLAATDVRKRFGAALALGTWGADSAAAAMPILREVLVSGTDQEVSHALSELGTMKDGGRPAIDEVVRLLTCDRPDIRKRAAETIKKMGVEPDRR